jgi:sugar phosphate isomerase/epimerase
MTGFSYQLYSSREFPPLIDTLRMLKAAGYASVEGYGGVYGDMPALLAGLKETGLTMPTGHFGIDMLEKETSKALNIARATGMQAVYCPYLLPDQRPDTAAGYRAFAKRLTEAGKPVRDAGLIFGWHNHDFEFVALADGSIPQEILFEEAPDLSWEADIAWVVRGKADPLDWIKRHGDRISTVHVKDIAPAGEKTDEDGWADVGDGVVDWAAIFKALKQTPARWFVMEHDKPSDHARFARRSIANAKSLQGAA